MVHHSLLLSPPLANAYLNDRPTVGSWPWVLTDTPLHLIWAGTEAVFLFFVLSGFVLTLPAAQGRRLNLQRYYPQRALRLYIPIALGAALALGLINAVARTVHPGASWWLNAHATTAGVGDAVRIGEAVYGTNYLNSAYWSLQWEVTFSIALPLFVIAMVRLRLWAPVSAAVLIVALVHSTHSSHHSWLYLPMFGLGALMAQQIGALDRAGARLNAMPRWLQADLLMLATVMLTYRWLVPLNHFAQDSQAFTTAALLVTLAGACAIVWIFASVDLGHRIGTNRVIAWLGKRSFSLYLVHEPIVVTTAFLLHGTTDAGLVLAIALPVSLLAAEIFGRLCEVPAHRLARYVGQVIPAFPERRAAAPAPRTA